MGALGETQTGPRPRLSSRVLARGETLSAFAGVTFFGVVALVLAASGWWTLRTSHEARQEDNARRVEAVGTLLATSAEALLDKNEVSLLRGLVKDTARRERLTECRVTLPDGTVVADSDFKKLSPKALPETWEPFPTARTENASGRVFPLEVRGRGPAELLMRADDTWSPWGDGKTQLGLGAISVGGFALLLGAYRVVRIRLRAAGAVAESVVQASDGERAFGVLRVADHWGPVASAWNRLAAERERLLMDAQIDKAIGGSGVADDQNSDFGVMFDTLGSGLILIDEHQRVCRANGAASILLQAKRELLIGTELRRLIANTDLLSAVESALTGVNRHSATIEVKAADHKDEGSVLRYRVKPVRREGAAAVMLVIEDVTQQRVADDARNAFVAQATHELRTPLTNIRLYMDALVDGDDQDPAARAKALNVVSQEARRLERIVSDMLNVSEIEAGSMKLMKGDVRLDTLFEELEHDYRALATDKEIDLKFSLPPKFPVVQADRDKLALAIHNLIGNALKYTPLGGKVEVRVEETPDGLAVDVQDNGIGVKPEEHDKIFDRFYRAKDKRLAGITGSGLGLALAREIARLHGGNITLKSEIDKGSTFRLCVPLRTSEALGAMAKAA